MAKRKLTWTVVLILALVLAVLILMNGRDQLAVQQTTSPMPTPTPTSAKMTAKKPPVSDTAQQTQVYSEVVKQYVGRHIQFDANCQAIPTQTTFKNGAAVLLDNRSGDARTIKIGDVSYSFPGYGYKILTLSSSTLPKTLNLNCGSAVNVGSILIQN
ncbi:MAG: hypothetical protein HYT65_03170 [Candidatus Yanofskybacteria bacterium]|nr:hypothetical protein [Candidatus Yanofskybacteria bacterium]